MKLINQQIAQVAHRRQFWLASIMVFVWLIALGSMVLGVRQLLAPVSYDLPLMIVWVVVSILFAVFITVHLALLTIGFFLWDSEFSWVFAFVTGIGGLAFALGNGTALAGKQFAGASIATFIVLTVLFLADIVLLILSSRSDAK